MKKRIFLLCLLLAAWTAGGCAAGSTSQNNEPETEETQTADNDKDDDDYDGEDDDDEEDEGEEIRPEADAVFGAPDNDFVEEITIDDDDLDDDGHGNGDGDDHNGDDSDEQTDDGDEDDRDDGDDDSIVFKDLDDGTEVENRVAIPKNASKGYRLSYPPIDVFGLDNTAIGWGMGPGRDEFNRPITALQYQQEYGQYNVDFIIPEDDPATEKKLYLTFDEGYENGFTPSILDTLKAHNANAVFFVTKPYAESCPELVQRMIDEGHIVGNHTVNHPSDGMQAHDLEYQTNEVVELNDYIRDTFDYQMCLFRYPTGKFSPQSLAIVSNCGYRSVFWSFAYADWDRNNQPNPQEALAKLETSLHPGAIYLLHAVSETNASILNDFLTFVETQGYDYGDYYNTLD